MDPNFLRTINIYWSKVFSRLKILKRPKCFQTKFFWPAFFWLNIFFDKFSWAKNLFGTSSPAESKSYLLTLVLFLLSSLLRSFPFCGCFLFSCHLRYPSFCKLLGIIPCLEPRKKGKLFGGTVPQNNTLFIRKVPPNNTLHGGTVLQNSTEHLIQTNHILFNEMFLTLRLKHF